jgi:hypothetical protein
MKQLLIFSFILLPAFSFAQNVGINISSPQAALDVYGDVIHRSADLVVANGTTLALDVNGNKFSYYRVNGPTANFTLAGIAQGVDGRLVTLFNRSGFVMQLNNLDAAASVNDRIITGTNADLTIDDRGIVNLQYDGAEQKWIVLSNSKPSAGINNVWGLAGNSGTNPATDFIGTADNQPFIIKSNNQTVAEFQYGLPSNNYIGTNFQRTGIGIIGVGAPTHTLEVGLADLAGGSLGVLGIRGSTHMTHFNYGANEDVYIRGGKNGSHVLLNDLAGLGNVGIGISNPDPLYKLHLWTSGENALKIDGTNSIVAFHDRQSNAQYGFFRLWTNAPFNPAGYYGMEIGVPPIAGGDPPKRLMFSTSYNLRMVIMENGNVGIGTANPANKLSVNGDIRSREVIVETANWPDYVFHPKYTLAPLAQVEAFIAANNHLPNIPAAAEIEKNGLKLGEVQKKMMEKIEELTLYIIQQQKQIDELRKKAGLLN